MIERRPDALRVEQLRPAEPRTADALDLVCPYDSVTVLTGPSARETGAWLETLAMLRPFSEGHLHACGYDGNSGNNGELRPRVGYVDTDAPLLSTFDVRMNVMLPRLYHFRESHTQARQCADRLLDRLDYRGLRDVPPARLNPLENLQVLLARALSLDPPLVLLDEPFDIDIAADWPWVTERVHALAHHDHRTVLVATRNLAFAAAHADQLVFIQDGQVNVFASWQEFMHLEQSAGFAAQLPFTIAEREW